MKTPRLPRVLADWNRVHAGDVPLSGIVAHEHTDFGPLEGQRVLLVDSGECVGAVIYRHSDGRWWGNADWSTQRDCQGDEAWPETGPSVW